MDAQPVAIVRALAIVIAAGSLAPFSATAQPSAPNTSSVPRTPEGHPDLQGVWDFGSVTALERPAALAGKEFLTDEDVADLEAQALLHGYGLCPGRSGRLGDRLHGPRRRGQSLRRANWPRPSRQSR